LQPCKSIQYCSIPYPSIRSIPFSYYTCHAQANAQKRYSLFFFWKCLPHWNCKSVINYNRLLGKLFCQKRIKKEAKVGGYNWPFKFKPFGFLKKSPPYRVVFFQKNLLVQSPPPDEMAFFFFRFFLCQKNFCQGGFRKKTKSSQNGKIHT
jgi:hypothetical protein